VFVALVGAMHCAGEAKSDVGATAGSNQGGGAGAATLGDAGAVAQGGYGGTPGAATLGDAGAIGQGGASEQTCASPTADGCPADLIAYKGQKVDLAKSCLDAEEVVSCSSGASEARTCWVDSTTGAIYTLAEIPCKPDPKWRDCTMDESDSVAGIGKDCQ